MLAPIAATLIAEAVRLVIKRRRSETLFRTAAAGALVGSLPGLLGRIVVMDLFAILWYGLYTVTVTSTVYYRLKGMVFKR